MGREGLGVKWLPAYNTHDAGCGGGPRTRGGARGRTHIDLCATSEFERTRQTADVALAGRDVPRLVAADLNDPRYGRYEGGALDAYREWAAGAGPRRKRRAGERAAGQIVARYVRGSCARYVRRGGALVVAHSLPIAYVLAAGDGDPPRAHAAGAPCAPVPVRADGLDARRTSWTAGAPLRRGEARRCALAAALGCAGVAAYAGAQVAAPRAAAARLARRRAGCPARRKTCVRSHSSRDNIGMRSDSRGARRGVRPGTRLIAPRREVTCLVSGGADSTCLWHVLRELGYASRRCT